MGDTTRLLPRKHVAAFATAFLCLNGAGWLLVGQKLVHAGAHGEARSGESESRVPGISVALTLPSQDLHSADRLTFVFGEPLLETGTGGEGVNGESNPPSEAFPAIEAAPFDIEPAVDGTWEWSAVDRLSFLPSAPLGFCRRFVFSPTAELERIAGRQVSPDAQVTVETGPLEIHDVRIAGSNNTQVTMEVEFNVPVGHDALTEALSVHPKADRVAAPQRVRRAAQAPERTPSREPEADGPAPLAVEVLTRGAKRTHRIRFGRPAANLVAVTVTDTLQPAEGDLGLARIYRRSYRLPDRFTVVRSYADIFREQVGGTITLRFSESLKPGQESLPIVVTPAPENLTSRINGRRLVLEGGFMPRTEYRVRVGASVLAEGGQSLGHDVTRSVTMPRRSPVLRIPQSDGILSPGGNLTLSLRAGSIDAVRVTAHEVLPGNIVEHARGARKQYTSSRVHRHVYDLPGGTDASQPVGLYTLDLADLFADSPDGVRGIYRISVEDTGSRWNSASTTLRVTDLGATAKQDAKGVHVWARSIASANPLSNTRVSVMTVTDQLLGSATTDGSGYAFVPASSKENAGSPYLVLLERAAEGNQRDTAYLSLDSQRWDVPREVAHGRDVATSADVLLYPERSIYRPGDTVHHPGVARSPGGLVHQTPLRLVIERPDGAVALDETAEPSPSQGHFHLDFPTSRDARTGIWNLRAEDPASDEIVGRASFSLEAFLPARIELTAAAEAHESRTGGKTHVTARSLAGTRVDGFAADAFVRWTPIAPSPKAYPLFQFKPASDERVRRGASQSTTLDEEGHAELELLGESELDPGLAPGLWRGRVEWTVTEPGSRSSVATASTVLDTSNGHLGLRLDRRAGLELGARESGDAGVHAVAAGSPFHAVALALAPTMAPSGSGRLWLRLDRIDVDYELRDSGGRMRWVRQETVHAIWNGPMAPKNGVARTEVTCPSEGRYRLTLTGDKDDSAERAAVAVNFYATDGDPTRFEPPQGDMELVTITAEAGPARAGEPLNLQLRSPVSGMALVTLEDARVRWHGQVAMVDGKAELQVPVPEDLRGGAILTAQVIRPLDATQASWTPHRAYGFLRVPTSHPASLVETIIEAPERVRPGAKVTVTVDTRVQGESGDRPAICHLWAVDEGIRIAGGHRMPNPRKHFFGPRSYSSKSTDNWFDLSEDLNLAGLATHIGGDAGLPGAARRRAPEHVHRVPGVIWLEAVEVDADGRATFEVEAPEFTGELTWMATVFDSDRYGSAQAKTRLAGEVPMLVSSPRFVAPGDRFTLGVRMENQTDETVTVTPVLDLTGPFLERPQGSTAIEAGFSGSGGAAPPSFTLAPAERAEHLFHLEGTGPGRIAGFLRLEGAFASGREAVEVARLDVPVRSGLPLVQVSGTRVLRAEDPGAATIRPAEFLGLDRGSDLAGGTMSISSDFGIGLAAAGQYLTEYPFGCAEQTASRIWALLALPTLVAAGDDPEAAWDETKSRVDAGFRRLGMMQTTGGGIAYWPGNTQPSPWASAYVAELMHDAAELEFEVPEALRNGLCNYLEAELAGTPTSHVLQQSVFVHALVALGRPQPGWTRRLAEQAERLGPGGRALVASAFSKEGELQAAKGLILDSRAAPSLDGSAPGRFGRLTSPVRTAALNLRTLLQSDPTSALVPGLAQSLESSRKGHAGRWRNTVDNAAALVALAQFHRAHSGSKADWTASVTLGGTDAVTVTNTSQWDVGLAAAPDAVEIDAAGTGPLFVTVHMEGRAAGSEPARDAGLVVRRRMLDRNGEELGSPKVRIGDLVFVELTLMTQSGAPVSDVAIVDPLPGGFEVVNPRLSPVAMDEESDLRRGTPDRTEFLDDRVLIFDTAFGLPHVYRYALRAVAPGSFEHGPVQAEAMYAPEVSSIGGPAGALTVER